MLRLAHMLRAFNAKSVSGRYTGIGLTDDPSNSLGQTPMYAPTVFNFFRPGYVPTSQTLMTNNLVVPEMQIVTDVSVAGYHELHPRLDAAQRHPRHQARVHRREGAGRHAGGAGRRG